MQADSASSAIDSIKSRAPHQGMGRASSAFSRSASRIPTSARPRRASLAWLDRGWHGDMDYMARHGARRARPGELVPGTVRVISARMNYRPAEARDGREVTEDGNRAFVVALCAGTRLSSRCCGDACRRLQIVSSARSGDFRYRVFTDSAPVMEVELAAKGGTRLARQAHAAALTATRAPSSFSARSTPICRCRSTFPNQTTAARVRAASRSARRGRSWLRTSSMRAAASRISPSSITARSRRSCGR